MSTNDIYSHILVMKTGPYCNFSLEEIIRIKQSEDAKIGKFFWGYSGVFCRPNAVNSFVTHAQIQGDYPVVMFSTTPSAYNTPDGGRFTHFSFDNNYWYSLPEEVLLVGNKKAPHFAITAHNLREVNIRLDLSNYCTFIGALPYPNKQLCEYLKYRVDKACGYYLPNKSASECTITINYIGELVDPYCVYIK